MATPLYGMDPRTFDHDMTAAAKHTTGEEAFPRNSHHADIYRYTE